MLSVSYNKNGDSSPAKMAELRHFLEKNIKDALERLDDVAKIEFRGGEEKEILVEIDKGRLLVNQLSIIDVVTVLENFNITYPAGTIKEAKHEYLVKTVGEFENIEDITSPSFSKEDYAEDRARSSKNKKVKNQIQ